MNRYTIREHKYEADSPRARLQELEDKIEDEMLIDISIAKPKTKGEHVRSDLQNWINSFDGGIKEFSVLCSALILIQKQDKEITKLENRLKECENGYEGTLALERAKVKELNEENKKLRQSGVHANSIEEWQDFLSKTRSEEKTDTVKKMQERLEEKLNDVARWSMYGDETEYFIIGKAFIDQIAKEVLEERDAEEGRLT